MISILGQLPSPKSKLLDSNNTFFKEDFTPPEEEMIIEESERNFTSLIDVQDQIIGEFMQESFKLKETIIEKMEFEDRDQNEIDATSAFFNRQ